MDGRFTLGIFKYQIEVGILLEYFMYGGMVSIVNLKIPYKSKKHVTQYYLKVNTEIKVALLISTSPFIKVG